MRYLFLAFMLLGCALKKEKDFTQSALKPTPTAILLAPGSDHEQCPGYTSEDEDGYAWCVPDKNEYFPENEHFLP